MKLRILALAVLSLPALGLAEEAKTEVVALKAIRDAVVIVEGGKIKAVGSGRVAFVMKGGRIYKLNGSPIP